MEDKAKSEGRGVVLGVCGYSESGKTTLIEALVGVLKAEGVAVAVVKHHGHPLRMAGGSDTERFFRAGAAVLSYDGTSTVFWREQRGAYSAAEAVKQLGGEFEVVLVEGFKHSELPKLWLLRPGESGPPEGVGKVVAVLGWEEDRLGRALGILREWLGKR